MTAVERRYVLGHPPEDMPGADAARTLLLTQRLALPSGEIWAVDTWLDGHRSREVVGNWITGEIWGRGGAS